MSRRASARSARTSRRRGLTRRLRSPRRARTRRRTAPARRPRSSARRAWRARARSTATRTASGRRSAPDGRRKAINQFKAKPGSGGGWSSSGSGADKPKRDYLTKGQTAAGITQLTELKDLTAKAKRGDLFRPGTGNPAPKGRYGAETKVKTYAGSRPQAPVARARRRRRRLRRPHQRLHRAAAPACRLQAARRRRRPGCQDAQAVHEDHDRPEHRHLPQGRAPQPQGHY